MDSFHDLSYRGPVTDNQRGRPRFESIYKGALLFAVYVATAKFGLTFNTVSGFASLVWLSTGIAFAALVLYGTWLWPAVALGALVVNMWVGAPLAVACGIALGNTLEALLGAYLFRRVVGAHATLDRLRHVVALVVLVAGVSTLVSATLGVTSLFIGGLVESGAYWRTWRAWWIGDALSDLVIGAFVLVWSQRPVVRVTLKHAMEGLFWGVLVVGLSVLIFVWSGPSPEVIAEAEVWRHVFPYLIFPLLMWTIIRYGQHANTAFALTLSAIAIWGTVFGRGPFQASDVSTRLLLLQLFVASVSITGLFFGALGREKENALRLRTEFLSIASHELKTPLTSMKLQLQVALHGIENGLLASDPGKVKELLESSTLQVDRLTKLINNLLDISRVQDGRLQLEREEVDLAALVTEVLERFKPQIKAARSELRVSIPPSVPGRWDRYRIEQVVTNLLTNALKYGSGSPIEILLSREGNIAGLSFKDYGIGIAEEHMARIFEPYERAVVGRRISGLGLGLYISKQIVEAHHGSIRVESKIGVGSTFTVSLPS